MQGFVQGWESAAADAESARHVRDTLAGISRASPEKPVSVADVSEALEQLAAEKGPSPFLVLVFADVVALFETSARRLQELIGHLKA